MPRRKKLLFLCGSVDQTRQMHRIARELPEHEHAFSPQYVDRDLEILRRIGALEGTIGGDRLRGRCLRYLHEHGLTIDDGGRRGHYDLVFHGSDLAWPRNLDGVPAILVQEGMTDPEGALLPLVQRFPELPGWVAGTSATGLSDRYQRFCVASPGFRDLFVRRGVRRDKIVVTGVPNLDDCRRYLANEFPHSGYVLVCTSGVRDPFGWSDRRAFIERARRIAAGRRLIFKLHPGEDLQRATGEIARWAPEAWVFASGSAEEMVANCDVLVCRYSSLALVGLVLGKEVHSCFDPDELRHLLPLQHGRAAANIAEVARELLADQAPAARAAVAGAPPRQRHLEYRVVAGPEGHRATA